MSATITEKVSEKVTSKVTGKGKRKMEETNAVEKPRRKEEVKVEQIKLPRETQIRKKISLDVVREYAAAYKRGDELPAPRAIYDGANYWVWDGFHRTEAWTDKEVGLGKKTMVLDVQDGTLDDAMWMATSANSTHGLRLTTAEKQLAVFRAIALRPNASASEIARHVGCDKDTVTARKRELADLPKVQANLEKARTGLSEAIGHQQEAAAVEGEKDHQKAIEKAEAEYQAAQGKLEAAKKFATNAGYIVSADGRVFNRKAPAVAPASPVKIKDAGGHTVPKKIADVFADSTLEGTVKAIFTAKAHTEGTWQKAALTLATTHPHLDYDKFSEWAAAAVDALGAMAELLQSARPHTICPHCRGQQTVEVDGTDEPCDYCRGSCGFLTEDEAIAKQLTGEG